MVTYRRYLLRLYFLLREDSISIRQQRVKEMESVLALASKSFKSLREQMANADKLVPPEFLICREDFTREEQPIAGGTSSKVFRGTFGGQEVAVKVRSFPDSVSPDPLVSQCLNTSPFHHCM